MSNFDTELLNKLAGQCRTKEDIVGKNGIVHQLMKRAFEAALKGEMDNHLGYVRHSIEGKNTGNSRNGHSRKRIKGDFGEIEIETPRDRSGSFAPQLIEKRQSRFDGFDDKIIALYSRGMTVRDIKSTLKEMYDVEVSPTLISNVTDSVIDEVSAWQSRPLDEVYPIVFLDCIVVKIHQDKRVIKKAVYLALGVNMEGKKELLGMWISENEGAKFWLSVLTELKGRGLKDIFIACCDGLTGFPEAINAVYKDTKIQLCIVHMIRNSLRYVSYKDLKEIVSDLKSIYRALTLDEAESALEAFSAKWDKKYPSISRLWLNHWENIITIFDYPEDIRKAIYTTNAIESLNMTIRKAIKNRRIFPNDTSAMKIIYLAVKKASEKWNMPIRDWKPALNRFAIEFGDRFPG